MKKLLKKKVKKLTLDRETLARLNVVGGQAAAKAATEPASGGPDICWFSDCNPCDTDWQCSALQ